MDEASFTDLDRQIVSTALRMMAENIGRMGKARGDFALGVSGGTDVIVDRCIFLADKIYPAEKGDEIRNA